MAETIDLRYIVLTGSGTWEVPEDWNDNENWIYCIGAGGDGSNLGGGGGGGAIAWHENVDLTPNDIVSFQTGTGDTWFSASDFLMAKGGSDASGISGGQGGQASASIGTFKFSGGNGGDGAPDDFTHGGGGGGSAASPEGAGHHGGNGNVEMSSSAGGGGAGTGAGGQDGFYDSAPVGGDGGVALDGTPGGVGGSSTVLPGDGARGSGGGGASQAGEDAGHGGDGTYFNDIAGPGGGGGGGKLALPAPSPGDGGLFGGGGGGGGNDSTGGSGGIVIVYRPFNLLQDIMEKVRNGTPGKLIHVVDVDAAEVGVPGDEAPISVRYSYGIGSTPIDALSLGETTSTDARTFVFSDEEYRALDSDPDGPKVALARINQSFSLDRRLNLSPAAASAGFSWGSITVARKNDDYSVDGVFEGINYYSTDGVRCRVALGFKEYDPERGTYLTPDVDELRTLFNGTAQEWIIGRDTVTIPLRDSMYVLDRPLQRKLYGGSGGLDGDATIAGLPLPKARGGTSSFPINNVKPVLVDQTNRIYQYNDGPGTVEEVYEGAFAAFTNQGDTTDLYSGSTNAGEYRTDNSKGLFQLGSDPVGEITCDVTGRFPKAGAITNVVDIAHYLLLEDLQVSQYRVRSKAFDDAATLFPYLGGVYFAPERNVSAIDAVSFVLQSIYAKLATDNEGLLRPFVVQAYTGDQFATYDAESIVRIEEQKIPAEFSPVVSEFLVRYGKNWTIQNSGFNASVPPSRIQEVQSNGPTAKWGDPEQALRFSNAKGPITVETALLEEADAIAVANQLGALWGKQRRAYALTLPVFGLQSDLGACIRLSEDIGLRPSPAFGYQYGVTYQPSDRACTIYLVI